MLSIPVNGQPTKKINNRTYIQGMERISCAGVNLSYKVGGQGKRTFVLIHNAGGSHQFLDKQFDYLSQFGRVVALDLRGHGESDKPQQDYSVEGYADDVAYLCHENGIETAIFVGLNYGSNISVSLANRTSLASALVLIDPPMFMDSWVVKMLEAYVKELHAPQPKGLAATVVEEAMLQATPEDKQMAMQAYDMTESYVVRSTYENLLKEDESSATQIKGCTMPVLLIRPDKSFSSSGALQRHCPHMVVGQVVGSSHWASVEVADQVNAMIRRFVEVQFAADAL